MSKRVNTTGSLFWYYVINIFSFFSLYFIKTAVKKALSEYDATLQARERASVKEQAKKELDTEK